MQELMVYAGHLDVYARASEIIEKLVRVPASTATIFRVSNSYGAALEPLLALPSPALEVPGDQVIYAEIDGSMIFTNSQWREVKLGRVFASDAIAESGDPSRGQSITQSEYTAHLGTSTEFLKKFRLVTDKYATLGERLVFLSDGARWIEQWTAQQYPKATQILDFYHAIEYLADFAETAISDSEARSLWRSEQIEHLRNGQIDRVIGAIRRRARGATAVVEQCAARVVGYYRANRQRMRYDEYLSRGLYIGSGAIESAHRTVIQRRMKLSGQRWEQTGAENMLNLRVASLSGKWNLVENLIKNPLPLAA